VDDGTTLTIDRLDGEHLRLDGLGLARAFFTGDLSSIGVGAYDAIAGRGNPNQITRDDIRAINTTMRARSKPERWAPLFDRNLDWLERLSPQLDLIAADESEWMGADGERLVALALGETIGPWRGPSVATKVLHLKRPKIFPVIDDFVAVMLGVNMPADAPHARRVEIALRLVLHLRREGRRNIAQLQRVQRELAAQGISRPLLRILDAIVWSSHPAAGVPRMRRTIAVSIASEIDR
jgi:hypothetical protein